MKLLANVTPPPIIYHGCYTRKTFWEENFTLANMTSCGRRNIKKQRKIKNGAQGIILDIYSKLDCLDKR